MYLQQLQYFVSAAEELNFSKAARQLYISQSALSYGIASLENEWGIKLFHRSKQLVSLTEAGEVLYPEIKSILKKLDASLQFARKKSADMGGELRIGFLQTLLRTHFSSWIVPFQLKNPQTRLDITVHSPWEINRDILSGTLDLGITRLFNLSGEEGIEWDALYETGCVIVMREDHPLAKSDKLDFEQLSKTPLIGMQDDVSPSWNKLVESVFAENGGKPNIIHSVKSVDVVAAMVAGGAGIGLFQSSCQIVYAGYEKELVAIPIEGEAARQLVVAIWKAGTENPIRNMLVDAIKSQL